MAVGILKCFLLLLALGSGSGERWRFPDDAVAADSVRIDAKVGFVDEFGNKRNNRQEFQADEVTFEQPKDTHGFYNRPPGDGRYPVHVEPGRSDHRDIRINGRPAHGHAGQLSQRYEDGTLDSLQYCKCVSTPQCPGRRQHENSCGPDQYLCCYNVPGKQNGLQSEFFNEVDDDRPMLFPGQPNRVGPFSSQNFDNNGILGPGQGVGGFQSQPAVLVGPGGPTGINRPQNRPVLVGPDGPTGIIGPGGLTGEDGNKRPVLVGPGGPTGVIGPEGSNGAHERPILVGPEGATGFIGLNNYKPTFVRTRDPTGMIRPQNKPVLVGPGGPTGVIGPGPSSGDPGRPILVGPGGPTGIIGPANEDRYDSFLVRPIGSTNDIRQSESAQRGVLVGPGGPTGIIGPSFLGSMLSAFNRAVLVGPSGPTGIIGPRLVGPGGPTGRIGPDFSRQARGPGVLVGPGGPTGIIGPGRPILVGPGGPTGRIGPRNFFGK